MVECRLLSPINKTVLAVNNDFSVAASASKRVVGWFAAVRFFFHKTKIEIELAWLAWTSQDMGYF